MSVMVKEQRFLLKEREEHHGIFSHWELDHAKFARFILILYLPQNDSILLPFNPMKS